MQENDYFIENSIKQLKKLIDTSPYYNESQKLCFLTILEDFINLLHKKELLV